MAAPKTIDTTAASKARLEARVPIEKKERYERAAAQEGHTLTDFMIAHLDIAADEVLGRTEVTVLSPRDSELFVRTLLNPPEPNESLRKGWEDYRKTFGE